MQIFFRALLSIYLAHLLTDFVFQTQELVARKRQRQFSAYWIHGLIHYFSAILIVGFFITGSILSARVHSVVLALVLVHLLIDLAKIELTNRVWLNDGPLAYLSDQTLHLVTVIVAAAFLTPATSAGAAMDLLRGARNLPGKFMAVPVIYIAVVFGGGYLIRFLTRSLAENAKSHSPEKASAQLQNAGLYIGWLERFLVVTAILLQSPAMVGLILTAKSIARYPEFKSERFAEYFLIGTLLSLAIAITGGVFLSKLIFGQIRLS